VHKVVYPCLHKFCGINHVFFTYSTNNGHGSHSISKSLTKSSKRRTFVESMIFLHASIIASHVFVVLTSILHLASIIAFYTNYLKQRQPVLICFISVIHQQDNVKCIQEFHRIRMSLKHITRNLRRHMTPTPVNVLVTLKQRHKLLHFCSWASN